MASDSELSYYRLRHKEELTNNIDCKRVLRNLRFAGKHGPKIQVLGLGKLNRKRRLFCRIKITWCKALRRLKKGQTHLNDLFGGNHLFMLAIPAPLKCSTGNIA